MQMRPLSEMCLCPPDFVMAYKVKGEDRWVIGRRFTQAPPAMLAADATEDALEYLAGNYSEWEVLCQHCGLPYASGAA